MAHPSDVEEVTAGLMDSFRNLREGGLTDTAFREAVELANTGGKVLSAYKLRLLYAKLRKEAPDIPGLTTTAA